MIRVSYVSCTTSSTPVLSAGRRNLYIYTMFSSAPTVETTYAQTFSPSATTTMTGITSAVGTFASS